MSLPKCFDLLNTAYFTNLAARIEGAGSETELQTVVNDMIADLSMLESTITSQIALLEPINALLSAPANPTQVITWIGNFITGFLTPYVAPYVNLASQLTAIGTQVATLTSTIESVAAAKGWSVTVPSITIGCTL
jgi:hypothetical protein